MVHLTGRTCGLFRGVQIARIWLLLQRLNMAQVSPFKEIIIRGRHSQTVDSLDEKPIHSYYCLLFRFYQWGKPALPLVSFILFWQVNAYI